MKHEDRDAIRVTPDGEGKSATIAQRALDIGCRLIGGMHPTTIPRPDSNSKHRLGSRPSPEPVAALRLLLHQETP